MTPEVLKQVMEPFDTTKPVGKGSAFCVWLPVPATG